MLFVALLTPRACKRTQYNESFTGYFKNVFFHLSKYYLFLNPDALFNETTCPRLNLIFG